MHSTDIVGCGKRYKHNAPKKQNLDKCQDTINSTYLEQNLETHHRAKNCRYLRNKNTRSIKISLLPVHIPTAWGLKRLTYLHFSTHLPHKFYNYTC